MTTKPTTLPDAEESILYAALVVIGVIPVAITLVRHAVFGFDATLGLLMLGVGVLGILVQAWRFLYGR